MVKLNKNGYYDISYQKIIGGTKKHFHKRSVSKSKKEAKRIEQEMIAELEGKILSITLFELFKKKISTLEKNGNSQGTYKTYENLMKNHIVPFLPDKEINKYKENDFDNYIDILLENGRSNSVVNKCISLLKTLFNFAKKKRYLSILSPVDNVEYLPITKRKLPYYFTYSEFLEFIKACIEVEDDPILWETIWTVLFELGLRKSELEPLQVKDINFDHMTISINKHIVEGHGEIIILPGRKNGDGYEAPMSIKLAKLIRKRIEEIENYDGYSKNAYLFNVDGIMRPAARTTLKRHLDKVCEAGGFENTTPHAFRHMCCLNLCEIGADVFTIANHIGDTVELIEKVYGGRIRSHKYARNLLNEQNGDN